jgi:hypothetical protein
VGKPVEKSLKLPEKGEVNGTLIRMTKKQLVTQPVEKVFDLITPELTLVLDVFFICEILYQQDRLV